MGNDIQQIIIKLTKIVWWLWENEGLWPICYHLEIRIQKVKY